MRLNGSGGTGRQGTGMRDGEQRSFLSGGGEMGGLLRAHDWSRSELGPPENWPQCLKTAVGLLLNSGYPMYLAWGPSFIQIYNDAYRPILGDTKHPGALGTGTADTFAEIWDFIGPMFRTVLEKAQASTFTDQLLALNRFGFPEECYFVFSYSPVLLETGEAGGVFVTVLETTDRVLRERRQRVLKDVAAKQAQVDRSAIFHHAAETIASCREDVPFVAIGAPDEDGAWSISAFAGPDGARPPALLALRSAAGGAHADGMVELEEGIVCPPWPEPVTRVACRTVVPPGSTAPAGMIVSALSPRLHWDEPYRAFIDTCASNLAAVVADAETLDLERKRAEALAEIDRAKTVFFSNVSHEFRTPLTLMLGPLEDTLADDRGLDDAHRSRLEAVHRNSLRLLKLVNSLLDFSRIEAGRMNAFYRPTDLVKLTTDLVSSFRSATEKAGLALNVRATPLPQSVYLDRDMWENIILNLVSNAFKFTLEGEITVDVGPAADGRSAIVTVRDTGVGIPADQLPRLFERFHRIEGVQGRSIEGSGIGLALVQELVSLHGATLSVQSQHGKGSSFTVTLPYGSEHLPREHVGQDEQPVSASSRSSGFVAEALRWLPVGNAAHSNTLASEPASVPRRSATSTGHRVLVADDNPDMRDYIRHLLEGGGYHVEVAPDGLEALSAVERRRPDLILSDVMMPKLDGFGLLRALRDKEATRGIPLIMLSARAGQEAKIEGLDAGANDYIVKPFSSRELFARVASAIELSKVRLNAAKTIRDEYARFRDLFDQAPSFMAILRGPDHTFEFANAAYVRLVGKRRLLGRSVKEAFPDIAEQGFLEILDRVYRTGERFVGENMPLRLQLSPESPPQDLFLNFVYEPITDPNGKVTGIIVEGHDVTQQSLQQQHLRLLINELNHRVKNTLAIVQAISQQTFKDAFDPDLAREAFAGRLAALATAHDLLTRQNWESTDLASIAGEVMCAHHDEARRIRAAGPSVSLLPKTAVTIAIALHELCTNATKHGALSTAEGSVSMTWSIAQDTEPRISIVWRETGGPTVRPPTRRGFGTQMIERALAAELRGTVRLDFKPSGLVCEIDAPLPQGERHE